MIVRRFAAVTAAVTVIGGSALALGALPASAATPTITAGPGSSANCQITATVKLSPGLKNDWVQSQHSSDPDANVRAIPDTTFASNGPVTTTVKGSGTCTGNVTDGVHTAAVTGVKFTLSTDPANPGSSAEATCTSLTAGGSTAEYITNLKWSASGAKVTPTTVTDSTITPSGAGFKNSGGTVTGSFAGGSGTAQGNVDQTTINAILQAPPTSANPTPAYPQCQPTLKIKSSPKGEKVSLKGPKGLKKILIVSGSTLDFSDGTSSS